VKASVSNNILSFKLHFVIAVADLLGTDTRTTKSSHIQDPNLDAGIALLSPGYPLTR